MLLFIHAFSNFILSQPSFLKWTGFSAFARIVLPLRVDDHEHFVAAVLWYAAAAHSENS